MNGGDSDGRGLLDLASCNYNNINNTNKNEMIHVDSSTMARFFCHFASTWQNPIAPSPSFDRFFRLGKDFTLSRI